MSGLERLARGAVAALLLAASACTGELTSPTEPLRLLADAFPAVYLREAVDLPLRPTGGLRPYTFTVIDGALPPGLNVAAGRISGTPSEEGRFAFTIEVSDAALNRTVQRFELLVRPLPEPVLRVDAPATEVQRATTLRLRLESARGWSGGKIELLWEADAFELAEGSVTPSRGELATFWEADPGRLRVDLAVLGGALDGDLELLRFTLEPITPQPLRLTVEAESRYAGGHHHAARREGAPAQAASETPEGPQ